MIMESQWRRSCDNLFFIVIFEIIKYGYFVRNNDTKFGKSMEKIILKWFTVLTAYYLCKYTVVSLIFEGIEFRGFAISDCFVGF